MRFVPLSETEGPAYRFVPLETPQSAEPVAVTQEAPTAAPMAGTMAGFELPEPAPGEVPAEVGAPEMRAYTPTLMQRISELLPGNKARALNEYIARQIARERGVSVEQVYRDVGGAQPIFNPEGRAPITAAAEAAGVIAEELPKVPGAVASTALRAYRAGEFDVVDKTWVDRAITAMKPDRDGKPDPNYAAFQGLGESLGFSIANMVASITSGAAATSLTGGNPLAGVAAGMATSGTIAYRASKDDFLERVKDKLDKQSKALYGKPLSSEDWQAASEEFNQAAVEYGLWEAIPEAVSNAIFLKAFAGPAKGLGSSRLAALAPKAGALAVEQATETITGLGQNAAERKANLTDEELSVVDAFRQQFLQTLLISGVMGGGLKGKQLAEQFYREQVETKIDPASALGRAIQAEIDAVAFNPQSIREEAIQAARGRAPRNLADLAAATAPVAPMPPGEPPEEPAAPPSGAAPAARAEPSLGTEPTVAETRAEPRLGPPMEPPAPPPLPPSEPPPAPPTPPTGAATRPAVTPVPGMPTGEELEEPEAVTPVTTVTPVTGPGSPAEPAVSGFTTEKGSTYEVTPEGQTIRTKLSPGRGQGTTYEPHTVLYVTPDNLGEIQSDLSTGMGDNAVRLGYMKDNKFELAQTPADFPQGAQAVVGIFNRQTNDQVGIYPAVNAPAVGLHPIEKLYKSDGMSSTHLGNKIVQITSAKPAPTVTPVTPTFKPTQAAAKLPETPTVAPITTPKTFEPPPVNLELKGLPTVEVPLTQLSLSKDVPQFKIGATAEGVVEPLGGKFERTGVAPIQVWRRLDGSLEVISGRHRFDLAKRSGEKTIPAQIHDESKGFGKLQASILDAELNIRDGQGKVKDYVNYFKESGITKQDADARGLLARATGKRSYTIATQGGDELIAAVRADQIGDEAAFYIALNAPNDARLQSVGIKAIQDGKSMNTATNMMQAVKALAGETDTTLDMFGFDDSAIREAEEMAKIASQKQREIQTRLSAISGAAKNPAVAKAEGIDIRDPEAVKRRIEELKQRKAAWDNWSTSPDLVAEIRAARGVEPPAPTIVEPPAEAPAEAPSLFGEDLLTAPTPEDLRAKEEAAARRAREAAEAERRARADEERGDYVLTGSDRPADQAAARGQLELGEAAPEPTWSGDTGPAKRGDRRRFLIDTPNGSVRVDLDFSGRPGLSSAMHGASISSTGFRSIIGDVIANEARAMADPEGFARQMVESAQAERQATERKRQRKVKPAGEAPAATKGAAPEPQNAPDENDPGVLGASDQEVADVARALKQAKKGQDDEGVTRVFDAPNKEDVVRIEDKARIYVADAGYLTVAQAKQRIAEWKKHAEAQDGSRANSEKIVLSLFDMTGEWSKPWEEAGYQVYRFDIQTDPEMGDVNKFSAEFFNDLYGAFEGQDVYAILAACPCTDFASSGARHFAAKDADGRTVESVELVQQTLRTVEYFKPSVWAIENPVGRIEKLTGLPPWRLSFNPNHFGDPYTKKTLLWGRFNADLPIAPVEPIEGSKMHRMYGGKSQTTKNARSVTPEGFAYAFFMANNAIDNPVMALANKYDMMDRAVLKEALDAGLSENQITDVVDDPYYFSQNYRQAEADLRAAIKTAATPAATKGPASSALVNKYQMLLDDQRQAVQYEDSERGQVKTETAQWQGTISRAEFDDLAKLASATPMRGGKKYSIQLVDTPQESSVLTMTARGLTPTQKQVEVVMVRQRSVLTGRGIPLENIPPKQMGFGFDDAEATDFIARNNPVAAQALSKADQLPGAKKKLPPGRSPELAEAARQLKAGQITAVEYDALVNRYRPIAVYTEPLKPASEKQVYDALDTAKRDKINPDIADGYPIGLRLDIPAFNRAGVFVVSIHEKRTPSAPGKVIGYASVASIRNATFGVGNQQAALRIATGEAKDALQTIEGLYTPITPEEAYQRAEQALKSSEWTQIGIDPTRHSYFYDRKTTRPVIKAEEIIQIGNMVLGKNVTYGDKADFLFSPPQEMEREEAERLAVGQTREEQIAEYAGLRRRLAGVVKKVAEGKVDIDVQRNTTDMMQRSRELQAAIKLSKPRVDTPEAFLAKALQEYDKGNISKDVLDVIQAAYAKQPELLDGLLLRVRKEDTEAAGRFNPVARIVYLFKQTSGVEEPSTIRHELSHSLEQMMTPEQRVVVIQAWGKALARAIKQNPDELHQRYFNAVLDFLEKPSVRSFRKAQSLLPSYEMYQFINPSEYWAVNAEKLMAAQLGTAWDRFKKAVRQLLEGLKKVLGFDNRYEVHKVFSQVMGGSKERMTRDALVDLVMEGDGSQYVTLNNINDADKILKKYNRPNTPTNDLRPLSTFVTQQFKNGKEAFADMVENPKEAIVGTYNSVSDGLTKVRIQNVFFGAGVEKRDFERYGGQLRTSDKIVTASVALDNAIRGGNIAVEVISRGGIEYNDKLGNFIAVKTDLGMSGVYRAEKKLKDQLGNQRGTDIINGYFEAKRSISIIDEFNERSQQLAATTENYNVLKAASGDPDAVAQAKAAMDEAREDVESIKKAVSSVSMSQEEMYEFAALEDVYPELRDMMDNWNAINQNLLRFWRQVGLLSQGRYETLSGIKDYVPWYRIMDDAADIHDPVQSTTRTFVNIGREKLFKRGQPVVRLDMRATEGQKEFNVPAVSVTKVKVNDKAVDPQKVLLSPDGKIILDIDLQDNDLVTFETIREIQNIVDNMTRNVMRMTMNGLRQFAQNRIVLEYATRNYKNKIQIYSAVDPARNRFNWTVNGKKVVVEIADPLVAAGVYGLEPVNFGKALGAMFKASEMAANLLRRSITLSGAFQIKQVFKDAPTAAIVTGVKNPLALIGGVWKGFLTSLTNTDPVVDILKSAGIGGYMSPARTPEAELKRRMGIINRNVFSFVIKGLDHIGDSADMAQRVAVYKRVLKETGDETQALYQAANVINYLRRGKAGHAQAMVKLVPFMGAYMNATDVLLQTLMLRGLKGKSRAELAGRLLATTTTLSLICLLYAMLAGADPDYDEVDDQTKLRNVFIPGTEIMMPMNTSAAYIFKVIPELLYINLLRQSTDSKMDEKRLRRALGESAKDLLLGPEPIPAGLKPLLEVGVNRSFYTGRDIVPENMQKLEPFQQFTASTSEFAKKLGEYTNMSPMNIDHLVRGLFGSLGAMVQWASNSMAVAVGERPELTTRETPVVGGFLRPELPRGREDLYYDFRKDVLEKYTTYNRMIEQENLDEADKYLDKHAKLIEMYDYINDVDQSLQTVNAEIRRVALSKSKDITPKERRSEMKELQRVKQDVVDGILDVRRETYGLSSLVRQPAR